VENVDLSTSQKNTLHIANHVTTVGKIGEIEFFIDYSLEICNAVNAEWIVPLKVNETIIPFKLDTGAQVNLLSLDDYKTPKVKSKIHPVKMKVTGYTGENVPVKRKQFRAQLLIVEKSVQPILGINACEKLNLLKRVYVVTD
jgi:hypothetical protein